MTTTVFYSEAGDAGGAAQDGTVRQYIRDWSFDTIRNTATGNSNSTTSTSDGPRLKSSTTTDQFEELYRCGITFDTSSIPDTDTVDSAELFVYRSSSNNGHGIPTFHLVDFAPADPGNFGFGDYDAFSYTSLASWGIATSNYITVPTASVSKTGVTSLGILLAWDINNSFTGSWSSAGTLTYIAYRMTDYSGTTTDPTLTVVHSAPASPTSGRMIGGGMIPG